MRAAAYYLISFFMLIIYISQVSHQISASNIHCLIVSLLIIFGFGLFLRHYLIEFIVNKADYSTQVLRQFITELAVFVVMGIVFMIYVSPFFTFSYEIKFAPAFIIMGLFTAVEFSLKRERQLIRYCVRTKKHIDVHGKYLPVPIKLMIISIICIASVTFVMTTVVNKDIKWLITLQKSGLYLDQHIIVILKMSIIAFIFLALIINLIHSYAKNLRMLLNNQNNALKSLYSGNMNVEVPICTNDEFGSMAYYTNKMIRKLRQYTNELKASKKVTILCLSSLAESRDNETGAHILRTKFYVLALARKLSNHPRFSAFLDDETINLLGNCSQLHDIGKVGIPDSILLKPGKLTPEEFEIMKRHTIIGRDAFLAAKKRLGSGTTPFLELAQEIVYTHHEKWDGTGYPQGLKGEEIPISGRIMALADVYDALISKRVYKKAFTHEKAKEIIISERGKHFDPDIVDAFLAVEEKFKRIAHVYIDSGASDDCTLGE